MICTIVTVPQLPLPTTTTGAVVGSGSCHFHFHSTVLSPRRPGRGYFQRPSRRQFSFRLVWFEARRFPPLDRAVFATNGLVCSIYVVVCAVVDFLFSPLHSYWMCSNTRSLCFYFSSHSCFASFTSVLFCCLFVLRVRLAGDYCCEPTLLSVSLNVLS